MFVEIPPVEDAFEKVTKPVLLIENKETPEDDATLKGLTPGAPCTLKVYKEEVAFTPSTAPLSKRVLVERVFAEINLATKPLIPPVTPLPPVIPSEDVEIQRVLVPVESNTCPNVPVALAPSRRNEFIEIFCNEREEIEVVANVLVPKTTKDPVEVD